MDFKDSPEEAAFRAEVKAWLDANAPRKTAEQEDELPSMLDERDDESYIAAAKAWQKKMHDAGWATITWPPEYGGRGATPMQAYIFSQEMSRYDVPSGVYVIGLGMIGPTIMVHGSDEQKRRFLPPMRDGSEIWCQLWSEPNAGSDVASLQTRAERDPGGGDWILNGQKVWTTGAQYSKWGLIIARTDPDTPKHRGISAFIVDMTEPGVTVRPLRQMTGGSTFNEVFFDDVKVPAGQLVGDVNDGWRVALTTLMNERFAIGVGGARGATLQPLFKLARKTDLNGRPASEDPQIRQDLARVAIHARLLSLTGYRALTKVSKGGIPGPEGSAMKLVGTRLATEVSELGTRILGLSSLLMEQDAPDKGQWAMAFLGAPGIHLAGGTDEIMRNIIGERVLGLPKEPQVDRDLPFRELRVGTQR
ncbi:MAG TPA: acyl-CoA dehydrogenase family protein [Actinomycetota bacterium]|nr:acyl-CoA dehydrogenase family protein [Actinomycetota bacterium]